MPDESQETDVCGHCYCGVVRYRVRLPADAEPGFTAYCHCDSCRRAHAAPTPRRAAPLYPVVAVDLQEFEITDGSEHLVRFQKPGGTIGETSPAIFRPQKHYCPEDWVLDREMLERLFHEPSV